jgi:outer membrane usher protein
LTAKVGESSTVAAPYAKSGVLVNFDVRLATNVILRAILPDGQPLPEGAVASVFPSNDKFPVGMDGKLYLQGIDRSSEITIRWSGKTCGLDVPYPPGASPVISKLGNIVCVPESAHD